MDFGECYTQKGEKMSRLRILQIWTLSNIVWSGYSIIHLTSKFPPYEQNPDTMFAWSLAIFILIQQTILFIIFFRFSLKKVKK